VLRGPLRTRRAAAAPERGAISAFSTLAEPQAGQVTSPRLLLLVVVGRILEPASNSCPVADQRVADHAGPRPHAGRRLRERLDDLEAAAVLQRGNAAARRATSAGSISAIDHAGLDAAFGEDAAPGSTTSEWPKVSRPFSCVPPLRGREHEAAVLDRARAHQHVPVRLAGLARERGGNRQEDAPASASAR
jgi:hypothetical protein